MSRRSGIAALVATASCGLLLLTGCGSTRTEQAVPVATEKIVLNVQNDQVAQHDWNAKGFDVGDVDVFSDKLSQEGKQIGYDGGSCWFTNTGGPESPITNCSVTIHLPDGQLIAQGVGEHSLKPFHMAIIGGSGKYLAARGEMLVTGIQTPDEKYEITLEKR